MQHFIEFLPLSPDPFMASCSLGNTKMDFVGVFSLALIVAFGGGTLRDLFLDRHPLFWIRESHYTVIVFLLAVAVFFVPRFPKKTEQLLSIPDALALGLFSVAGTDAAIQSETSLFIAAMLGAVTGTFGGVIGDIICNRIPSLFRPSTPLYATCSFVGSWGLYRTESISDADRSCGPRRDCIHRNLSLGVAPIRLDSAILDSGRRYQRRGIGNI